jgi:hypothetical protein
MCDTRGHVSTSVVAKNLCSLESPRALPLTDAETLLPVLDVTPPTPWMGLLKQAPIRSTWDPSPVITIASLRREVVSERSVSVLGAEGGGRCWGTNRFIPGSRAS